MAKGSRGTIIVTLIVVTISTSIGSSHWIVTEDGRVNSQDDSIFSMRRPYDLVALLRQEERALMLKTLKKELANKKQLIDQNEDKETGLEKKFYKTDPDCIAAGKPLPEYDLYISTILPLENKGIRSDEHINLKKQVDLPDDELQEPHCVDALELPFSIHAFEHLQGVQNRRNLSGTVEDGLKNAITHRDKVEYYGHLIHGALLKNSTSWVLYNMAAFYWRIKGNPLQAVECVRRALHFSPQHHKDVALISLANILHRSRYSHEAAILVNTALQVSQQLNVNHFTLGNIYAVLGEYNKSMTYFRKSLRIQPDFEAAEKRLLAVMCHSKLEKALERQHRSLQQTLNDLRQYQYDHDHWQQQNDKMHLERASPDQKQTYKRGFEQHKKALEERGIVDNCKMEAEDGGEERLRCTRGRRKVTFEALNKQYEAKREIEQKTKPKGRAVVDLTNPVNPPLYNTKKHHDAEYAGKQPHLQPGWPEKNQCEFKKFPRWDEFPTNFLPETNKGFVIIPLLMDYQGLPHGSQHPLPWYPPVCVTQADITEGPRSYDHIRSVQERAKVPLEMKDETMRTILLSYVTLEVTEDELGQRILSALRLKKGPSWALFNLAALYWRIVGNNYHAIECVRRALYFAPEQYKDVPLVNLANIFYKWGRIDDAVLVVKDALEINEFEPETQFFMGNLLAAKANLTGAIHHYEAALAQFPSHVEAAKMLRLCRCFQKFHAKKQTEQQRQAELDEDSQVFCKKDLRGKESCVVETPTDVCDKCKQRCHVRPLSHGKGAGCPKGNTPTTPCTSSAGGQANQCKQSSPPGDLNVGPDPPVAPGCVAENGDYTVSDPKKCVGGHRSPPIAGKKWVGHLEVASEYFRSHGMCEGEDCDRLLVQCQNPFRNRYGSTVWYMWGRVHPAIKNSLLRRPGNGASDQSCSGEQRPHLHLELVGSKIQQHLIFVNSPEEISVPAVDCLIYNDGRRSAGCLRREFQDYVTYVVGADDFETRLDSIVAQHAAHTSIHKPLPLLVYVPPMTAEGPSGPDANPSDKQEADDDVTKATNKDGVNTEVTAMELEVDESGFVDLDSSDTAEEEDNTADALDTSLTSYLDVLPGIERLLNTMETTLNSVTAKIKGGDKEEYGENETTMKPKRDAKKDAGKKAKPEVKRFVDEDGVETKEVDVERHAFEQIAFSARDIILMKPEPRRHIKKQWQVRSSWDECKKRYEPKKRFGFTSSWLSDSIKGILLGEHIDFENDPSATAEPLCIPPKRGSEDLDLLLTSSVMGRLTRRTLAEVTLGPTLERLGGAEAENAITVGARIALALQQNMTSWVLANQATLYWRVLGNPVEAINCIRLSYAKAPPGAKDLSMLNLANILANAGFLPEAVIALDIAMEADASTAVTHFTLANIYVMMEDFVNAIRFYQSTLGIQRKFTPARDVLMQIQCDKVLSNPHLYKPIK